MSAGGPSVAELQRLLSNSTNFTAAARSLYSDVMGFVHAVDWSERWLQMIGVFHVLVWLVTIGTRRFNDFQMVWLFLLRAQPLHSKHCSSCFDVQAAHGSWFGLLCGADQCHGRGALAELRAAKLL